MMRTMQAAVWMGAILSGVVMGGCAQHEVAGGWAGAGMTELVTPGLEAWKVPKPNPFWTVTDGVLMGANDAALTGDVLYTVREYRDVEVDTEFRMTGDGDSGVDLRKVLQVQIGISSSLKVDKTGSLFQEGTGGGYVGNAVGVDKVLKRGQWNRLRFVAKGDLLKVWVNGVEVLTTSIAKYPEAGPLGLQLHPGLDMKIEFRGFRVRGL